MEHLIITRFYNIQFSNCDVDIFSNDILENAIYLMKNILIPSLENQSNKNFSHIILINEEHNKNNPSILTELYNIKTSYPTIILTNKEFEKYLKNIKEKELIITRIDYDDAIYFDAVNDTQNNFNKNEFLKFYGYRNGLTYDIANNNCYLCNTLYKTGGTNSQFQSIMFNNFQLFTGNIFYDHSNVYKFFKDNNIKINNKNYCINEKIKNAYIWTMHDKNGHYFFKMKKNKVKHFSNKNIKITNEEWKKMFGFTKLKNKELP